MSEQVSHQGPSDPFRDDRRRMVEQQLRARGITHARVLAAMQEIPRERFIPSEEQGLAYVDSALPIGQEQTISQPFTVAMMAALADPQATDRVLEIGTGSGYGAAVLSRLARHVDTIERIPALAQSAERRLASLGYTNISVHTGDGSQGLPAEAPFDVIVVTAAAPGLPDVLREQLALHGRLIIPVDHQRGYQKMMRYRRESNGWREEPFGSYRFVPLIGRFGKSE